MGMSLEEATTEATRDLNELTSQRIGGVNIIAMGADGSHFSGITGDGKGRHIFMTPDMDGPETVEGIGVAYEGE
jgi:hypothetical protein